jgi:hypothetical protein
LPPFLNPIFQNIKSAGPSSATDAKPRQLEKNESIFSFISLKNKERLDSFISKASSTSSPVVVPKAPLPVYTVPTKVAEAALKGFMPFGADLDKQTRYKNFLQKILDDAKLEIAPEQATLNDAQAHESREFSKAAMIFRPLSDMIASRFTNETGKDKDVEKEVNIEFNNSYLLSKLYDLLRLGSRLLYFAEDTQSLMSVTNLEKIEPL